MGLVGTLTYKHVIEMWSKKASSSRNRGAVGAQWRTLLLTLD